jgi:Crinkler effector protein N-terminal domain
MAIFNLNCLIRGEDRKRIFPIEIGDDKTVGALRKLIKDNKHPVFDHIPADKLVLWKVSIAIGQDLKKSVGNLLLEDEESLMPDDDLADVFHKEPPAPKRVHIIVDQPLDGTYERIWVFIPS